MTEPQDGRDNEAIEQAKVAMAGPLGRELAGFPIRFAEPIYFGEPPSAGQTGYLKNGTATIIDLGHGTLAITCSHVLAEYRERLALSPDTTFQIGNLKVDPLARIQSEDIDVDLAVLNLDGCDLEQMCQRKVVESGVFRPPHWPPRAVEPGDFITVGGFPGAWRNRVGRAGIVYDSFSLVTTPVTAVHLDHFICQFEREYWVGSHEDRRDIRELGGMSGGPAFIHRDLYFEWVGVVYEFSSDFDLMYLRPSHLVGSDGRIRTASNAQDHG